MIKNIADVDTGIIFKLELQQSKLAMQREQFSSGYKPTTACVRRLSDSSSVLSQRTVFMDSWFTNIEGLLLQKDWKSDLPRTA